MEHLKYAKLEHIETFQCLDTDSNIDYDAKVLTRSKHYNQHLIVVKNH